MKGLIAQDINVDLFLGVGKTSLVHLICHNEPIGNPSWTIGCSTDVKVCEEFFDMIQCS